MSTQRHIGFTTLALAMLGASSLFACSADPGSLADGMNGGDDPTAVTPEGQKPGETVASCTEKPQGRSYKGYGQTLLEKDRANEAMGENRARVKPYEVLTGEYTRSLGAAPTSLSANASTFGEIPARWSEEATTSAVVMSTSYRIAFEGCLKYTATPPEFAAAPTDATATTNCTSMMRKFWSRTPQPAEVSACSKFATTGLAKEPDAKRRWAYVCSSVMTSTRFLTY
jgi:hypothetical protein